MRYFIVPLLFFVIITVFSCDSRESEEDCYINNSKYYNLEVRFKLQSENYEFTRYSKNIDGEFIPYSANMPVQYNKVEEDTYIYASYISPNLYQITFIVDPPSLDGFGSDSYFSVGDSVIYNLHAEYISYWVNKAWVNDSLIYDLSAGINNQFILKK